MAEAKQRKNRGHGEGSIYRLTDGRWRAEVMVGRKDNGKRDVRVVHGKTRGACQKKLDELRRRRDSGLLAQAGRDRETLAAYLDRWLIAIGGTVRSSTVARFKTIARLHIRPGLGDTRLSTLRPDAIQGLYSTKGDGQFSPTTVELIHVVLHKVLKDAVRWGDIGQNPADRVTRPRRVRYEAKPPSAQEIAALLSTADAARDRLLALWTLKAHIGARLGELLGLKWSDVDLARGTVSLQRGLVDVVEGRPILKEQKTTASRRAISIPDEVVSALVAHKDRQGSDRQRLGESYRDFGLVFATKLGTGLAERNVIRAFKLALRRARVRENIRLHDLRHAHATTLAEAGVNLKVISARLGHAGIQITADLYTHPSEESNRQAAEQYANALRKVQG